MRVFFIYFFLEGKRGLHLFLRIRLDYGVANHNGNTLFQNIQHAREHIERFFFIFVQRVFLTISTQNNGVAHQIQSGDMIFPQLIQNLQENALLHHFNSVGRQRGFTFCHAVVNFLQNPFFQAFAVKFRFVAPVGYRQYKAGGGC